MFYQLMKKLLLIAATLLAIACHGQTYKLFTANNELTNSIVNCILQDSFGKIWIATESGLNCYDGNKFIHFTHSEDSNSLCNNNVQVVYEDQYGRLLIGTQRGLQILDRKTNKFTNVGTRQVYNNSNNTNPSIHVTSIIERKNGEILVATSGYGLFVLTNDNGTPINRSYAPQQTPTMFLSKLFEDRHKNIWIATEGKGLFRFGANGGQKAFFTDNENVWQSITNIIEDKNGNLYVGANGLYRLNSKTDEFDEVTGDKKTPIKSIFLSDSLIYLGTIGHGLKIFNINTQKLLRDKINVTAFDFYKSEISCITRDRNGSIWLGIDTKGAMVLPEETSGFGYIGYQSRSRNIIGSNSVMSVLKSTDGTLWVGTANDGLYRISVNRKVTHYEPSATMPSTILAIFEDSRHRLWLGSLQDGAVRFDTNTGLTKRINLRDNKNNNVRHVPHFAEYNNQIFINVVGGGLYSVNMLTDEIYCYPTVKNGYEFRRNLNILPNRWIQTTMVSSSGKLYIGTFDGLGCLDINSNNFVSTYGVNSLFAENIVNSLYEDKSGIIWVGTNNGIIRLNEKNGEYHRFTTADGLPNDKICAITGDANNNLWISTANGLSCFSIENETFVNYFAGDGLQGNEFSTGAVTTWGNQILFGGTNGISFFEPKQITEYEKKPDVTIVDFYINNQPVMIGTKSGRHNVINTYVQQADTFMLNYQDNSFSIEFSAMDFCHPDRILYQYSLNNGDWIKLRQGESRAQFTGMAPGVYSFKVKAVDYGNESDVRQITVIISPAWYKSTLAILLYCLAFIAIIIFTIKGINQRHKVQLQIQEHIHTKQIDEAKLQFFINISHEIRTPMSLVMSPLQTLMSSDTSPEHQRLYKVIYRNSQRILRLINQLMDLRKIDKGQMALIFRETEMVGFLQDLCDIFEQQAEDKNIDFSFQHSMPELNTWVDSGNFDKIVLNLISNALKYTPDNGKITITLRQGEDKTVNTPLKNYFEIEVADNGIGIKEEEREHIFERFYQINNGNNSHIGTGVGLHLTRSLVELHYGTISVAAGENGCGSIFTVRLPLGNAHLPQSAIDANEYENSWAQTEQPKLELSANDNDDTQENNSTRKPRVLIAEDDEEIRKYISHEFAKFYNVIECENGKDALASILLKTPDLVISDIMMPEMDGISLCQKIKQNINVNHTPVVLLTAKVRDEDRMEAMDADADAYITKPFNIEILKKTVDNLIRNRKQLRNVYSGQQTQSDNQQNAGVQTPDEKLLERVLKVINENLSNPRLNIEMISQQVGISRVHLYRKMKELTNQSTSDYIRNARLKMAAQMLRQKNYPIAEIAALTGFNNPNNFSTIFKEMYGVPPSVYANSTDTDNSNSDDKTI